MHYVRVNCNRLQRYCNRLQSNFLKKKVIKLELDTEASIIICSDFIQFFDPSKNKVFQIIVDEGIRNINVHKKLS